MGHLKSTDDLPNVKEVVFRANYIPDDVKIKFDPGAAAVTNTVSNDRFRADVLEVDPNGTASSGDEYACFRFTALKDYAADTDNPSILYVTVGRISFIITVRQIDRSPVDWENGGNTITVNAAALTSDEERTGRSP